MVQSYFPDIAPGKAGTRAVAHSRLLYVRCMRERDLPLLATYRAEAQRWLDDPG